MSKYTPLTAFLANAAPRRLKLTFAEIEQVLGFPLPSSKRYPAWWSNNPSNNVMTKAWLKAGYRTEQVDVANENVVFSAVSAKAPAASAPSQATSPRSGRSPLHGCLKGTTIVMPGVDLTKPADSEWGNVYD
ncbi:hypothetical protein SAMN02983003_3491 [Devosia enhydra]|uniref:DUF7662 domain-containing protein n=1 Tax=Devosia enhydra TaxID=665118 RepID=A0A1K2I238_9HYPH|nr:hypothetical protein [Devosia enhydra]SFZ86311.1 hypothetical protein SAMN02983003_3491 [Devosia enhydra]